MMTAHTSLALDTSPILPSQDDDCHGHGGQAKDPTLTHAQSVRSWHTAQEHDLPSVPASHSRATLLAHSKSRSTHDLASLASGKNLVDHMERTQGEGWWSVDRPRLGRRASNVDTLRRRFGEREDDEADRRLALLEKLAKGSTLPHRQSIDDGAGPEGAIRRGATLGSPGEARHRANETDTPERERRPMSAFTGRDWPRTTMMDRIRAQGATATPSSRAGVARRDTIPWRPSSVQPRIRATYHGPRPSLVTGSTWSRGFAAQGGHDQSTAAGGRDDSIGGVASLFGDDTPTKPGRKGLNKISPDIARRASCITGRSASGQSGARDSLDLESPIRVRPRAPSTLTAGTQLPGGVAGGKVVEAVDPLEAVKAKHALELVAILEALGGSKAEAAGLREEVGALKKELNDCQGHRDVLRGRVRALEARIRELEGSPSAGVGKVVQPSQSGECWRVLLQVIVQC